MGKALARLPHSFQFVRNAILSANPTFALLLRDLPSRGRQGSFDPVGLHYKI